MMSSLKGTQTRKTDKKPELDHGTLEAICNPCVRSQVVSNQKLSGLRDCSAIYNE
jgi:hypothetical protein